MSHHSDEAIGISVRKWLGEIKHLECEHRAFGEEVRGIENDEPGKRIMTMHVCGQPNYREFFYWVRHILIMT